MDAIFNELFFDIMSAVVMFAGLVVGELARRVYKERVNNDTKRLLAKSVVEWAEQACKTFNGADKFTVACEKLSKWLTSKGLSCTAEELECLIEEAVFECKNQFKKEDITSEEGVA